MVAIDTFRLHVMYLFYYKYTNMKICFDKSTECVDVRPDSSLHQILLIFQDIEYPLAEMDGMQSTCVCCPEAHP